MLTTYDTIEESKQNKAFIIEYKPEQPYMEIAGIKFNIENAWLEHPHREISSGDTLVNIIFCFVMTLSSNKESKTDLQSYISEMGNGNDRVWRFVDIKKINDTISLKYRSTQSSQDKNKRFKFFPILQ